MPLFIPKRLLVKPQSKNAQKTKEIIARTRQYNPSVEVEYLNNRDFTYPVESPREKFLYMKESAIISERSESFIRTFDSPGNIVESLITVLNLTWMCANKCEYCYLQTNQTPEHYFYTNLKDAEHEIAASPAAHAAILTFWTHLTDYLGVRLMRLPDGFKETADSLRDYFVKAHVTRDADAIDRYFRMQSKLVDQLNEVNVRNQIDAKRFQRDHGTIKKWYAENLKFPLSLTASEFNDFLAVDHLTDNSSFLMQMLEKYPRFLFTIRSKSQFVDGFLPYDGLGRASFTMALNTDHVIREIEHGTATLDERIHAARRMQEAQGYRVSVVIEPMFTYNNHQGEYRKLIDRVFTDLDPSRIESITLGSVRYADQLKAMVRLHFPETKLFNEDQHLDAIIKPDTKHRYTPDTRKNLYSMIISEIKSRSNITVKLGSETPDLWKALAMSKDHELGKVVHEPSDKFGGTPSTNAIPQLEKPKASQTPLAKPKETAAKQTPKEDEADGEIPTEVDQEQLKEGVSPYWISISPQDFSMINTILGERDDSVPIDRFKEAFDCLCSMVTIEEMRETGASEIVGYSVKDEWVIHESRSLSSLFAKSSYFKPVKFVGWISKVSQITPHEVSDYETRNCLDLEITDTEGATVRTLDIQADCITVDLRKLHEDRTRCTFLGTLVPLYPKTKKAEARLYLHDIITDARPIDLVAWTPKGEDDKGFGVVINGKRYGVSNDHPSRIISTHPKPNGIIDYIVEELAQGLGIQALGDAPQLKRALEFVVLQAFSQGRGEILEKLHGLVIGPPNVGKSYLTKAALILNTVGHQISSNSEKITDAGLVGTVKSGKKKNVSEPGILPLNHGGVVCIQEFHDIRGARRKSICGRFVRMMEEGEVIESTTAATVHPAETALLIDMNRYSQINLSGHFDSYTDIDIPINMLARFDYIVEIPRDEQRSKSTASQMTQGIHELGGMKVSPEEYWKPRLRYLVAFLKTEFRAATFPTDVQNYIDDKVNALLDNFPAELQKLVEDMRLRIVRSVFKITKAVVTANASRVSTKESVDYALRFVQDKLDFIRSIDAHDIAMVKPSINDMEKRREIIEGEFRGKKFQIDDVIQFLESHMDGECEKRTIQRDLGKLGANPRKKPKGGWSWR